MPYLMKFYASTVDQSCWIMVTDMRQVWGEVLSSKRLARRWRECNPQNSPSLDQSDNDEDDWRSQVLELLTSAHSLGGIIDLKFTIEKTNRNADLAFILGSDDFQWRWETYSVGPRESADVLSRHLIMPLISLTHLAFSSADPVGELSESDLEKAIDKVGRTARRGMDTHVRHAVTKPRIATSLRRMAAVYNFANDHPPVLSEVPVPELKLPVLEQHIAAPTLPKAPLSVHAVDGTMSRPPSPSQKNELAAARPASPSPPSPAKGPAPTVEDDDSATEPEPEMEDVAPPQSAAGKARASLSPSLQAPSPSRSRRTSAQPEPHAASVDDESEGVAPARPAKKAKRFESSSEDESDEDRRRKAAQRKTASRGAKQPLKRGGRRF